MFTFGRMNPPTVGHEKLVSQMDYAASLDGNADVCIFLSHSQDRKKNPLDYDQKLALTREVFGTKVIASEAKTIIEVLQHINYYYKRAVMIVGDDRVDNFEKLLRDYNGKEYEFESLEVFSAGVRDPDSDDEVEGMSASKMRELAAQGNLKEFTKGLSKPLHKRAKDILNDVRIGMRILPIKW